MKLKLITIEILLWLFVDKRNILMTVEIVNINIPASPEEREAIKKVIIELSNSLTREQGEKEYRREAVKELSEKYEIPPKFLNKMAKDYFKDTFNKQVEEMSDYEALYETILS